MLFFPTLLALIFVVAVLGFRVFFFFTLDHISDFFVFLVSLDHLSYMNGPQETN